MMMRADMLPQNSCCFANASMWLKVFYIFRRLCKCTTTQKQRAIIHRYMQTGRSSQASQAIITSIMPSVSTLQNMYRDGNNYNFALHSMRYRLQL